MQPDIIPYAITDQDRLAWLQLYRTENIGPITFKRLIAQCGTAQDALEALPELSQRGGRKKPLKPAPIHQIEREYEALHRFGGTLLIAAEDSYPEALRAIDDAPQVLSALGDPALLSRSCIGMVGARNASLNGRKFAEKMAHALGEQNHIVVSGLARGIDTAAHKGALKSGTIAVVAGGIDVIYPEENTGLYEQIRDSGLILAESPFGQKPFAQSFPRRNRIVSGISSGVIVVEATMRSGSLITARLAGEQGRDVFAVPGHPFDPRAQGPNHLIREGATLVRSADDVIESLSDFSGRGLREIHVVQPEFTQAAPQDDVPEDAHEKVLAQLSFTPVTVDECIRACHVSVSVMQTVLLELELAGKVKRLPGNRVSLVE